MDERRKDGGIKQVGMHTVIIVSCVITCAPQPFRHRGRDADAIYLQGGEAALWLTLGLSQGDCSRANSRLACR